MTSLINRFGDIAGIVANQLSIKQAQDRQAALQEEQRNASLNQLLLTEQLRAEREDKKEEARADRDFRLESLRRKRGDTDFQRKEDLVNKQRSFGLLFQDQGDTLNTLKSRREQIAKDIPEFGRLLETLPSFDKRFNRRSGGSGRDSLTSALTKTQQQLDKEVKAREAYIRQKAGLPNRIPLSQEDINDLFDPKLFSKEEIEEHKKVVNNFDQSIEFFRGSADELTNRVGARQGIKGKLPSNPKLRTVF
jgi:hypothetical protein